MAVIEANAAVNIPLNTGTTDNVVMLAPKMLIAVPRYGFSFTLAQLADPVAWATVLIQAIASTRIRPLFGNAYPLRMVDNAKEDSVTDKLEDGVEKFVRFGIVGTTFGTTEGGETYTKILQSFVNKSVSWILIDEVGIMKVKRNKNGTFSGIASSSIIPNMPISADLKAVFKSMFKINFTRSEYSTTSTLLGGGDALLDLIGLIDVAAGNGGVASTTKLKVSFVEKYTNLDVTATIGSPIATVSNFVVTKISDGSVNTVTAALVGTNVELTGTFISGQSYLVTPTTTPTLYANGVIGYEIVNTVTIAIP